MHADNYGNLTLVRQAADKKYFAVECDMHYSGGAMWCYHDVPGSNCGTLQQNLEICKARGAKLLIDLKTESYDALYALAKYIKDNNLQKWVIVQTNTMSTMTYLNKTVGSRLEYWGVITSEASVLSSLINNASTYKNLGMTTVNISKYVSGTVFTLGTQGNINALRNRGYDVCVFTWTSFTAGEISWYTSCGVKYLMTSNISQK